MSHQHAGRQVTTFAQPQRARGAGRGRPRRAADRCCGGARRPEKQRAAPAAAARRRRLGRAGSGDRLLPAHRPHGGPGPALSAHDRHCRCDAGGAANRCEQDARACTFNDCRRRPPGLDRLGARRAVGADVSTRDRRAHCQLCDRQRQSLARDLVRKRRQPHRAARRDRSEKASGRCRSESHALPRRPQARSRASPHARLCDRRRGRRARRHGDRRSRARSGQRKGAGHDQHCRTGVAIVERASRPDRRRIARRRASAWQNLAAEAGRRKSHTPGAHDRFRHRNPRCQQDLRHRQPAASPRSNPSISISRPASSSPLSARPAAASRR